MATSDKKPRKKQQVFTLLVQAGRTANDGFPEGATGAAMMIYASGVDEAEAVRETVAILKQADVAPLDVTGYGTLEERLSESHDISGEERALMQRALDENAVIVAQITPLFEDLAEGPD
ncbi:MAG: hypothetical protein AAF891_05385 [Pseudomonadota bacterium]